MQTPHKFLAGSELGRRCWEVNPNGDGTLLITAPWAARRSRCELHGARGGRPK